jgi:antitoxin MazE
MRFRGHAGTGILGTIELPHSYISAFDRRVMARPADPESAIGFDIGSRSQYIHCVNKKRGSHVPVPAGIDTVEGDFVRLACDDLDALVIQDARILKAGNSLAIRIPSVIVKRMGLEDGTPVEMAVDHGVMYVRKAPSRVLADMIERITPQNLHEPSFEEPRGSERW